MLSHYFHALSEKYIAAFGTIFNDITLIKYNSARTGEIKRTKVPLVWGPREKYLIRNNEDHGLDKKIQASYPMMSYNLTGLTYSNSRKLNSMIRHPRAETVSGDADTVYEGVPYDLNFDLSIVSRNKDDAFQILEQILPSFNPNYTFSQILIPEIGIVKDIPLLLNGVSNNTEYESGFEDIIMVEYILSFTMQVYYYGPVSRTKIIRKVFANTFLDPTLSGGAIVRTNLANGNNGVYQTSDIVYQGNSLNEATAGGMVTRWNANTGQLVIGAVQGNFMANTAIKAASTNANYTIASIDFSPLKVMAIKIEPDPVTANRGDPFDFDESFTEFPETLD